MKPSTALVMSDEQRRTLEGWVVNSRSMGPVMTWFLLGTEVYTAFTFLGLAGFAFARGGGVFYNVATNDIGYAVGFFLLPAMWLHFFLRFPYPFPLRKNSKFLRALYLVFAVLGLWNLAGGLLQSIGRQYEAQIDPKQFEAIGKIIAVVFFGAPLRLVFVIILFGTIVAGVVFFWRGAWSLPTDRRRALLPATRWLTTFATNPRI